MSNSRSVCLSKGISWFQWQFVRIEFVWVYTEEGKRDEGSRGHCPNFLKVKKADGSWDTSESCEGEIRDVDDSIQLEWIRPEDAEQVVGSHHNYQSSCGDFSYKENSRRSTGWKGGDSSKHSSLKSKRSWNCWVPLSFLRVCGPLIGKLWTFSAALQSS